MKRSVGLRGLLLRYLAGTAALCAAVMAGWWLIFAMLLNLGVLLPASASSEACRAAATYVLPHMTADDFDPARLDPLCRYALFPAPDSDTVLATNMDGWHLDQALNAKRGGSGNVGYIQYHLPVTLEDGSFCLLQYDYAVPYANEALQARLPDFQACYLILLAVLLLACVWANTRRTARRICTDADRLKNACDQIAAGDLSGEAFGRAHIRELDAALGAMQTLREHLAASLRQQWDAEQQRAEQVAALSHDLKTPLTIISGHADLLAEGPLPPDAEASVQAVRRACQTAQACLADLRAAAAPGAAAAEPMEKMEARAFADARVQVGRALCQGSGKRFEADIRLPRDAVLYAQPHRLGRAADNLLDNAVRFAAPGGTVRLRAFCQDGRFVLEVRDDGPGFTQEALRKAGQFLYTGDTARHGLHQGLGLYMARAAAEAHGGGLEVQNSPQGGARVVLWVKNGKSGPFFGVPG